MSAVSESDKSFVGRALIVIGLVVLAFLILALLYFSFDVILLVFAAIMIAIFLRGTADLLGRFIKISEGWLVLIASVLVISIFAGAISLLAPSVAEQAGHLREELPKSLEAARLYIMQFGWGRAIMEQLPEPSAIWDNIASSGMLSRVGGIFSSTIGAVGNFLIVVLLSIYLAIEPKFYAQGFARLFPIPKRPRVFEVLANIGLSLQWWLIGKAGSMVFIALLTWLALAILGVPMAMTLGLIAGLLSFIPNFGPIMSAIPAILIAFVESPMMAVYTIGVFVGVQLIESNIVTPIIERETVELPPGLTIVFQLALAVMVGGLGLVLATPLLAVIIVVVEMVYIQDTLGDHESGKSERVTEEEVEASAAKLQEAE